MVVVHSWPRVGVGKACVVGLGRWSPVVVVLVAPGILGGNSWGLEIGRFGCDWQGLGVVAVGFRGCRLQAKHYPTVRMACSLLVGFDMPVGWFLALPPRVSDRWRLVGRLWRAALPVVRKFWVFWPTLVGGSCQQSQVVW